jgi:hypothetical protein
MLIAQSVRLAALAAPYWLNADAKLSSKPQITDGMLHMQHPKLLGGATFCQTAACATLHPAWPRRAPTTRASVMTHELPHWPSRHRLPRSPAVAGRVPLSLLPPAPPG